MKATRRSGLSADDPKAVERLAEIVRVWNGEGRDRKDRALTEREFREIIGEQTDEELAQAFGNAVRRENGSDDYGRSRFPERPTDVQIRGGFDTVSTMWRMPSYSGHSHTEIYRSTDGTLSSASLAARGTGIGYSDTTVESGHTYTYWLRHVNTAGSPGPWHEAGGTTVEVLTSPEYLLTELTGRITESQLFESLRDRLDNLDSQWTARVGTTVDGRTVVGGIGLAAQAGEGGEPEIDFGVMADRFWVANPEKDYSETGRSLPFIIQDGEVFINTAFIAEATIDDAQIRSVGADKVLADTLSAITANLGEITAGSINIGDQFMVSPDGVLTVTGQEEAAGGRMTLTNDRLEVFDSEGNLRVEIGRLSG